MNREDVMSALSAMPGMESRRLSPQQVMGALIDRGLIDFKAVEKLVARREVEALCATGVGRCYAIAEVAYKLCCSYEKIRAYIYQKNDKNNAIRN